MAVYAGSPFGAFCDYMRMLECAFHVPHRLTCDIWAIHQSIVLRTLRRCEPVDARDMWTTLRTTAQVSKVAEADPDAVKNFVHWGDRVFGLSAQAARDMDAMATAAAEENEPPDPFGGDLETMP